MVENGFHLAIRNDQIHITSVVEGVIMAVCSYVCFYVCMILFMYLLDILVEPSVKESFTTTVKLSLHKYDNIAMLGKIVKLFGIS